MEKRRRFKEIKRPSQISDLECYSKNVRSINNSKFKMKERRNKSEFKLETNYDRFLPSLQNDSYNSKYLRTANFEAIRRKSNIINSGFYNTKSTEELQRTLSFNKKRMIKNNNELNELKIQYNKLSEDSENNRRFLTKILKLKNNEQYTNAELLEKMKKSHFNNIDMKKMLESIKMINLKLEVNEKKSILKSKNNEFKYLKENAKLKNISDIEYELSDKIDMKEEINLDIQKLKEIILTKKKVIDEKVEEYKKYKEKYQDLIKEEENVLKNTVEFKKKSVNLQQIIAKLERKIQKQEIEINNIYRNQFKMAISIDESKKKFKEINDYLNKREEINLNVQKRKELIKNYENKNSELDEEYEKLNKENNNLMNKNNEIEKNYKKNKKLNGNKKENKLKDYEEMLEKIKTEIDNLKKDYEDNQKKCNEIKKKDEEIIQKNKKEINKRNEQINDLEKKKNELQLNIENSKNNINEIQKELDYRKKQIELIKEQRQKENDLVKDITEEQLQEESNKLNLENKNIKEDIEKIDKKLEKYKDIDQRLLDAQNGINNKNK